MNGADALIAASAGAGMEVCFANPGTSEMAMVDALRRNKALRPVLVLFEGVASGAADGYARIAGKVAGVMLHLGPGLGNATANLHNARRAQSPVVNWVGDHSTWLLPHDPCLASNIDAIARGSSQWVRTTRTLEDLPFDAVEAMQAAYGPVAGVATLIVPMDFAEAPLADGFVLPAATPARPLPRPLATREIEALAKALREAKSPLVLLGGPASDARGLRLGAAIAEAVGGKVLFEQFPRCARREPGLPSPDKLGYLPFMARGQLGEHDVVALFGADPPALFFGYPGEAPRLTRPDARVFDPARGGGDVHAALEAVAELVSAPKQPKNVARKAEFGEPSGLLEPTAICRAIAALLPENAIVVDEGITSSLPLYSTLTGAAAHDYLACKGGSIGFSTPVGTGAAIAAPGRRVITYVGDGSAAYTIQSLWTQAREGLDVTTIVLQNDKYAVLQMELMRTGAPVDDVNEALTNLQRPSLDFEAIGRGFGVPSRTVRDLPAFVAALKESLATPGPTLISCAFG
jgi:acetolactate synthase I/II/III large subunit